MKSIIVLLTIMLSLQACAPKIVPVTPDPVKVPTLPVALDKKPSALPPISGNDIKSVLTDSVATSRAYNGLRHDYIDLLNIYNCVKVSNNEKQDLGKCLSNTSD